MLGTQEELSIFGGPPVVGEGAVQPWPQVVAADKEAVMGVLERGVLWGAAAPEAMALQEEWSAYVGARHCLVTNSGTAALHMAVAAAGVQPGDEVITTPMSWSSTATSILHHNAIPVFADIDPETYTLDPNMRRGRDWLARLGLLVVLTLGLVGCQQDAAGVRPGRAITEMSPPSATSSQISEARPTAAPSPTRESLEGYEVRHFNCGPVWTYAFNLGSERHVLAWTPDGSHLLFNYESELGMDSNSPYSRTTLWKVDALGNRLDVFVEANPARESFYGLHADVSPDGTQVVYASCEFESEVGEERESISERAKYIYEIAVIGIDGTGRQRLTENAYLDLYPVWSPDGSRIAFLAAPRDTVPRTSESIREDENLELFTMAADGSDVQRLAPTGMYGLTIAPPVWSPDGERLAYLANAGDFLTFLSSLYTVKVDGSESTLIAEDVASVPSWSPDGQRLAAAKYFGDNVGLFTLAADGSDEKLITAITARMNLRARDIPFGLSIYTVSWSPDGTQILYSCELGACVVDVEDGQVAGLTTAEYEGEIVLMQAMEPYFAAWSPDGSRIAVFASVLWYRDLPQLFTVFPDGSDRRDLVRLDDDGNLVPANPPE